MNKSATRIPSWKYVSLILSHARDVNDLIPFCDKCWLANLPASAAHNLFQVKQSLCDCLHECLKLLIPCVGLCTALTPWLSLLKEGKHWWCLHLRLSNSVSFSFFSFCFFSGICWQCAAFTVILQTSAWIGRALDVTLTVNETVGLRAVFYH